MLKDLAITCTVTFKDGTTQKQTIKFEEIYMSNEELGVQRDADYKYNLSLIAIMLHSSYNIICENRPH